jgi:hypothetical protein
LFHLGQKARRGSLQNALHPSFWRSASACITDDAHQHTVAIPSVIQLMVTDVNVFTAVITNGKTKPFAAAAQTGFD